MKTKNKIPYMFFGPIITFGIMLVLYAVGGIYPFGDNSTAYSDGFAQYVPFLTELKSKILEGGSAFFSWHINGGINFWATIGYYLTSPLNLIALFFSVERMSDAFSLITLIKPCFLALTFGIYLKHTYKKNDLSVVIFSILWAMSGFMVGAIFITSWLDALVYFPLVILGLKKLMDGESAWLYSLFLGLTIISNFYIGWIVCIFCVIYFVYSFIADDDVVYEGVTAPKEKSEENKEDEENVNIFAIFKNSYLLNVMFRFGCASLLAGAFSAIFSLPITNALQNTAKGTISGESFTVEAENVLGLLASLVFPIKNIFSSFTSMECIFAFVGIGTMILAVSYFFTKGISVRKKIANGFLLVVMWASILINGIYFVWHGFGEPAGLMYRFAFIYSFVVLKIAYEAFCEIKNIKWYGFLTGIIFAGFCVACIYFNDFFKEAYFSASLIIKIVAFIIAFAVVLFVISKKERAKSVLTVVLLVCVIAESIILNYKNINTLELDKNLSENKIVSELTENIEKNEKVHFTSKNQEYRDIIMYGALFGYNALEGYSSLADQNFALTIHDLGTYGNAQNFQNGASEQTPVFNMLFPTKYYIDGVNNLSESVYRTKIAEKDGYTLYENNYTMPFMYTVNSKIEEWDPFAYMFAMDDCNAVVKKLTDTEENLVFYNQATNFEFENCTYIPAYERFEDKDTHVPKDYYDFLEERMDGYSYKITDTKKPVSITFDSVAETDGMMYIYADSQELVDMKVTINGKKNEYFVFGIGEKCVYELGEVKKGDVAKITVGGSLVETEGGDLYLRDNGCFTATSFTIDMEKFEKAYNKLDAMSDTEMLEFEDTYVKAKVTSYEDGILYIPTAYDEGWTITIDGEEVPLYEHESHILMTEISKGEHIVEMKYVPQGFILGAVITGVSVLILIAWAVILTKRFKKEQESDIIVSNDVNEE